MSELEVRIDRLRPREVAERMAVGPVAWIPLGAVEYHAEHLPFGTDGFTASVSGIRDCLMGLTKSDQVQALIIDRARYVGSDAGLIIQIGRAHV